MKRQLLIIVTMLLSTLVSAVTIDGIEYNLSSKRKEAEVTSKGTNGYKGDIAIPKTVEYDGVAYRVTSIGENAFAICHELTSIELPNTITTIGANAFDNCKGLTSIVIPNSVTKIEREAFLYSGLKTITLSNNLTAIEYRAFGGCENLTSIQLPNTINKIESLTFIDCINLETVIIPNSVTVINGLAFKNCISLTNITLPSNLKELSGFNGCTGLTSISIPESVETIGSSAFENCSNISSVNIPDNVKSIGSNAFQGCISLTSISIPSKVSKIGYYAFDHCTNLKTVYIERNGYMEIGDNAFGDCHELEDFYCYSEFVPYTPSNIFEDSFIDYATLHVPASYINDYLGKEPWKSFKSIISLPQLIYKVDGEVYKTVLPIIGKTITAEPEPTKEGYTFSGWSKIPENMPAHDVTVTGTFTINSYTITYKIDGEVFKTETVEYNSAITPPEAPAREGYTFEWIDVPETMPAKDVVITGTFTVNKYKLTYKVDGEEYKISEVEYGSAIVAEEEPTKEGYTFSGWSEIPKTMPAKDVVITGTFAINSYMITYKIDGEVFKTESVEYGSVITPPEAPAREGYTFEWMDVPETMPAKDITIEGSYTSGIGTVSMEEADVKWFTIDGKRIETPQKGVNIIRKSNGKTKKVFVK